MQQRRSVMREKGNTDVRVRVLCVRVLCMCARTHSPLVHHQWTRTDLAFWAWYSAAAARSVEKAVFRSTHRPKLPMSLFTKISSRSCASVFCGQ